MQVMDSDQSRRANLARAASKRDRGSCHPAYSEMDYTPREQEFMFAMHEYKRLSGHQFPTWCEVLRVLDGLGYERVAALKVFGSTEAA